METAIAHTDTPHQLAAVQTNPIAPMLEAIMAKGITAESAATLEKMIELYERVEAKNAQRACATAFVALQADVAKAGIEASKAVPDRHGVAKFFYAPYTEIMSKVGPLLVKHGFGVRWNMRVDATRIVMECTLVHTSGHEQTNSHATRIGSGPPNASEGQADGSAATMAKRRAICDALNIVVDLETDARSEGDTITPDVSARLERDANAAGIDTAKLLRLAGAESFDTITTAKVPIVERAIEDRKRAARPASAPATATAGDFADPGQWREAMVAEFTRRKAKNPEAAFAASLAKGGYTSYLDVPPFRRGVAWDALKGGKLDAFLGQG